MSNRATVVACPSLLFFLAVLSLALPGKAVATDQPDQLLTGLKLIVKTKSSDPSKNKIVFKSKDSSFDLPNASNDPTLGGALLRVIDLGDVGNSISIPLPKEGWKAIKNGFRFKGSSGDPCRSAKMRDDRLLKVVCKSSSVALTVPFTGDVGIGLIVGTSSVSYCAQFGGDKIKNQQKNGTGIFKAKNAPAPAVCLACGDGNLDPGEECDDGNNVAGDCCAGDCRFESIASPCDEGNPCTENGSCDGAGTCISSPVCGNGVVDAACGEQCDSPDDDACATICLEDCTCSPAPTCPADPSRVLYAGGPGTSACTQFDGNQALCEQAFHLGGGGVASCFWDEDSEQCRGCGPSNQADGNCVNTCDPPVCIGDATRTIFAGGPGSNACGQFDGDQSSCEQAFHIGQSGIASCFYDTGDDTCRGCGANNVDEGLCTNSCAACINDPTRTIFAGGPGTSACHQFDGNQAGCESAFHRGSCLTDISCYYDNGSCQGCGPQNEADGECQNTCADGPIRCENDPARTINAGGPGTGACHQFDGDPASCDQAFHVTGDCATKTASCFYDYSSESCNGCGPNNLLADLCVNTCDSGPITCPQDPARTLFAGMPETSACRELGLAAGSVACETAFHIGASGVASCYFDGSQCKGCGPANEGDSECVNTCVNGKCEADPTRTVFAGGPGTGACGQFTDQASCESAYHLGGQCGFASCFWDGSECLGCGPNNLLNGDCVNTCDPPTCDGDPARIVFAGGPNTSACHYFDGDPVNCNKAYHLGSGGVASCWYDADDETCNGCGPNNQSAGLCTNTCPVCEKDPDRTTFAGGPDTQACQQFDGDQAACEDAFHYDSCLRETSCFYDPDSGDCRGCGPNNFADGACFNTCKSPPICMKDPSRTIYVGGPSTSACQQFDGNPTSCLQAFHRGGAGIASCWYDFESDACRGCGPNNQEDGECVNTCLHGAPQCERDPTRTVFAGGPGSGACHQFDGNQAACESAFHFDSCRNPTSCYYTEFDECAGCGPNNASNGECLNTCKNGPASCENDPSRVLFGGGPGTGACQDFDDAESCLSAFHVGMCGAASCYWDGSCRGCGPNNEFGNAECFNTCTPPGVPVGTTGN